MYFEENLDKLLSKKLIEKENEHLEFKEAKAGFESEKLIKYCCALANEGGGCMILGVTDKLPRLIVGSYAFENMEDIKSKLIQRLQIRIDVDELLMEKGRVLVFTVPSRPIGVPLQYNGSYWMRREGRFGFNDTRYVKADF